MAFKYSTELRRQQCVVGSLKSILDGSVIRLYSGEPPRSADDRIINNTLLCELTAGGEGVTFEAQAQNAVLTKSLDEVWEGDVEAAGEVTFFRMVSQSDTGDKTDQEVRIQGTVGGPAEDLVISNSNLVQGAPQRLEYFAISLLETA